MGLDEVPVEALLATKRLPALFTPEEHHALDVVLLDVVLLELQTSFKLDVARFALETFQVQVSVRFQL